MNAFEKLTQLQLKVGYKTGEISAIALLGLAGESGEVMEETVLMSKNPAHHTLKRIFIEVSDGIDQLKKQIRDEKIDVKVALPETYVKKFDIEVADLLYYINAIAINRGKTLEDYAEMSYQKVSAKTQIDITGK